MAGLNQLTGCLLCLATHVAWGTVLPVQTPAVFSSCRPLHLLLVEAQSSNDVFSTLSQEPNTVCMKSAHRVQDRRERSVESGVVTIYPRRAGSSWSVYTAGRARCGPSPPFPVHTVSLSLFGVVGLAALAGGLAIKQACKRIRHHCLPPHPPMQPYTGPTVYPTASNPMMRVIVCVWLEPVG